MAGCRGYIVVSGHTFEIVKFIRSGRNGTAVRSLGPMYDDWTDCVSGAEAAAYEFINSNEGCTVRAQDDAYIIYNGKTVIAAFVFCTVYRGELHLTK